MVSSLCHNFNFYHGSCISFFTAGHGRFIFPLWGIVSVCLFYPLIKANGKWWVPLAFCFSFSILIVHAALFSQTLRKANEWLFLHCSDAEYLEANLGDTYHAMEFMNRNLKDRKIVFIGEARTYYMDRPQNVVYSTVFDYHPLRRYLSMSPSLCTIKQFKNDGLLFYVNQTELRRLQLSMAILSDLSEKEGSSTWNFSISSGIRAIS